MIAVALLVPCSIAGCGSSGSGGGGSLASITNAPNSPKRAGANNYLGLGSSATANGRQGSSAGPPGRGTPAASSPPAGGTPRGTSKRSATARLPVIPAHTPQQLSDDASVRATIGQVVSAFAARDPAACTTLFTQRYIESVNGKKGGAAVSACQHDLANFQQTLQLVKIEGVAIHGSAALAQFVTRVDGKQLTRQIFVLARAKTGWQVYGTRAVTKQP